MRGSSNKKTNVHRIDKRLKNHQLNGSARGPTNSSLDDSNFYFNTSPHTQDNFDKIMCQTIF